MKNEDFKDKHLNSNPDTFPVSDVSFEAKIDSIFLVMEFFLERHRTFCTLKIPKTTFYIKNREHFRLSDYSDRNKVTSLIASFVVIYLIQKQIRN